MDLETLNKEYVQFKSDLEKARKEIESLESKANDLADDKMRTLAKYSGAIKDDNDDNYYCIYCTSKTTPCPHRREREVIKEKFEYPIKSSSVYGWFKPYDNLGENHNKNSVTKSFYDHSHL